MKHIHGRIPLVEFTIILLFYTCRRISFSITFSFNPFCVKPGCSAHQTGLVTKKLCTGIFYRKWRINVKSCFYNNINQSRAACEHFSDVLLAVSSCTNCENYFKLCSEPVSSLSVSRPLPAGSSLRPGSRLCPTPAWEPEARCLPRTSLANSALSGARLGRRCREASAPTRCEAAVGGPACPWEQRAPHRPPRRRLLPSPAGSRPDVPGAGIAAGLQVSVTPPVLLHFTGSRISHQHPGSCSKNHFPLPCY